MFGLIFIASDVTTINYTQSFTDSKVDFYQFLKSLYQYINLKNYETPLRFELATLKVNLAYKAHLLCFLMTN